MKAEEKIKTRNDGKLFGRLTEDNFIRYCELWWVYNQWWSKYETLLSRFRNWLEIKFSDFWSNFDKNVFEYNWLKLKIWWKYIGGRLMMKISTVFPDRWS